MGKTSSSRGPASSSKARALRPAWDPQAILSASYVVAAPGLGSSCLETSAGHGGSPASNSLAALMAAQERNGVVYCSTHCFAHVSEAVASAGPSSCLAGNIALQQQKQENGLSTTAVKFVVCPSRTQQLLAFNAAKGSYTALEPAGQLDPRILQLLLSVKDTQELLLAQLENGLTCLN